MTQNPPTMLLALGQSGWEAEIVTRVLATIPAADVRRCVDVSNLVLEARATAARLVVLDSEFPRLDSAVVDAIAQHGVKVVGISANAAGLRRLEALGVGSVVPVTPTDPGSAVEPLRDHWINAVRGTAGPTTPTLQANADASDVGGRLIAVWGPPGAPGRTTTAIALAQQLSSEGSEVLLVDADTTSPGIGPALCMEPDGSGLIAACHHGERGTLDVGVLARLARAVDDQLRVLTGISHVSRRVELRAAAMSRLWQTSMLLAPMCVVDVGGCVDDGSLALDADVADFGINSSGHTAAVTALGVADELVVVSSCEPNAISRLLSYLPAIRSLAPSARLRVVVNRVRTPLVRTSSAAQELRQFVETHTKADNVVLVREDRQAIDAAIARGLTPFELNPTCDFITDMQVLSRDLASPMVATG